MKFQNEYAMNAEPIYSDFDDPDMLELVELYVMEMPERIASIQNLWANNDLDGLRKFAHQIKGSGSSYGFDVLTSTAAKLELAIKNNSENDLVRKHMEELIDQCKRAKAK